MKTQKGTEESQQRCSLDSGNTEGKISQSKEKPIKENVLVVKTIYFVRTTEQKLK